jgi:predicted MFS family arabinose efflux permease
MTLPARVIQAVRPQASPGVIAAAAVVAATFAATPFLLPDVAERLGVDIGATGLLSAAQVGSFAVASFLSGRILRPRRRLHYGALGLVGIATIGSALAPNFTVLLVTRLAAGVGLGMITWIAWADATRFSRGIGDVAAVAPITATVASPPLGWLTETGGFPLVYGALGLIALLAVLAPVDFGDLPRVGRTVSRSRSNRLLLAALLVVSMGGSAVFIFTGAAAIDVHDISPSLVAWALSVNAVTGVIATRQTARGGQAGWWLGGTALAALLVGTVSSPALLFLALALWGFSFWMAVPAVFKLLAEKSLVPSERIGDAQAAMATGRIFGPILGGLALGAGSYGRLSVVGTSVMVVGAVTVSIIEAYRSRETSSAEG